MKEELTEAIRGRGGRNKARTAPVMGVVEFSSRSPMELRRPLAGVNIWQWERVLADPGVEGEEQAGVVFLLPCKGDE